MSDQDGSRIEEPAGQLDSFRSTNDNDDLGILQNDNNPLKSHEESVLKVDQSLEDQNQNSVFHATQPKDYLQEIWDKQDDSLAFKQEVEEIVDGATSKVIDEIKSREISFHVPKPGLNKHNLEQRIAEERVRRLRQYYAELKHKLEGLECNLVLISPDQDRKEIEKIKSEMTKLDRVIKSLSPKNRKKPEYHPASELQEKYYDPSKKIHAKQFIDQLHKDWEEFEKKKQEREAERDQREREKMARLTEKIAEAKKQRNEERRMKYETKIQELQQRQEARRKLQAEWKKKYQEYLARKPLYKVKEEAYELFLQRQEEERAKALAQREQIVKPVPDYFFKEHQDAVKKKLEELRLEHELRRSQERKEMKLPELFHGKFHSIVEGEDKAIREAVVKKIEHGKEQFDKRKKYAKLVRESIKLKKRTKDPREEAEQKRHTVSMRSLEPKDQYNMGLKYLDFSKKHIKKKTIKDNTAIEPFPENPENEAEARRNSDMKVDNHRLPQIISARGEEKPEGLSHRMISKSVPKINYLPLLKQEHKGVKKVPEWRGVMKSDINKSEKMEYMKLNIQMYEENAKRAEKRLKYAPNNAKTDQEAANADDFYIKSLKAKLALVNDLQK